MQMPVTKIEMQPKSRLICVSDDYENERIDVK